MIAPTRTTLVGALSSVTTGDPTLAVLRAVAAGGSDQRGNVRRWDIAHFQSSEGELTGSLDRLVDMGWIIGSSEPNGNPVTVSAAGSIAGALRVTRSLLDGSNGATDTLECTDAERAVKPSIVWGGLRTQHPRFDA